MFGHQNDVITQDQHADASVPLPESTINALTSAPATTSDTDSPAPTASAPIMNDPAAAVVPDQPSEQVAVNVVPPAQQPSTDGIIAPTTSQSATPATPFSFPSTPPATTTPEPSIFTPSSPEPIASEPAEEPVTVVPATSTPLQPEDLLRIKQEALQSLSPLVGKLDVGPEEKFRTLMMLIQASDDHNKLTEAYEVAKTITDEKARAQALLDVVNEINYFTSKTK